MALWGIGFSGELAFWGIDRSPKIITPALDEFPETLQLPSTTNLAQMIRRVRAVSDNQPSNPRSAEEFEVPENLQTYSGG